MRTERRQFAGGTRGGGFTLIEVVLAVVIAGGLLVVAMYFYQQISRLRNDAMGRVQTLVTLRLVLDRITSDLRSAQSMGYFDSGFVGGPDFLQFVKTDVPALTSWMDDVSTATAPPSSDLQRVGYTYIVSVLSTNEMEGSLMRWEEPNLPWSSSGTLDADAEPESELEGELEAEALPVAAVSSATQTNVVEAGTRVTVGQIQYVHFRYYDGTDWRETWDGLGLPMGVEVQLSPQPWMPEESGGTDPLEPSYPEDLLTRVIYVPGNRADFESPEEYDWVPEAAGATNADAGSNITANAVSEEAP